MNPHPKFIPVHMRARLAGHRYATCRNCKFNLFRDYNSDWCSKTDEDPTPFEEMSRTVCELHEPGEPETQG